MLCMLFMFVMFVDYPYCTRRNLEDLEDLKSLLLDVEAFLFQVLPGPLETPAQGFHGLVPIYT